MKLDKPRRSLPAVAASDTRIGRRSLVAGAGIAGVAAVAATALSRGIANPSEAMASAAESSAEGYRLSDHVLRYYASTKA